MFGDRIDIEHIVFATHEHASLKMVIPSVWSIWLSMMALI